MENEVFPVIGNLDDPNTYIDVAKECTVYIHTAFDWKNYEVNCENLLTNFLVLDELTVKTFLKLGEEKPKSKLLIYTSGILV